MNGGLSVTTVNIVSPYLEGRIKNWPPEKQEEARKSFSEFLYGAVQSLIGDVRQAFVNKFFDTVGPLEKFKIEFIADKIVDAKNSNRLRSKTMIGLTAAFESGVKYAVEATKRGENPSDIIEALHTGVLTDEAEKAIEGRKKK
jgi:hypothetical protein